MNTKPLSLNFKFLILATLLLLNTKSYAQLNIQFNGVNEYLFNSSQVLNFTAINSNSKSYQVYFIGKIKDQNNDIVLEYKTTNVLLNVGANIFSKFNISFSELRFLNSDILEVEEKSGVFPYGAYQICMYAQCVEANCGDVGVNGGMETPECITVKVENPTPLLLAYPDNESEIEVTRPMYLWIPPSPIASSSQLNYRMRLVEIMDGQSKSDALTMNRPLIEESGIMKPSLMHPLDVPELEKGKWYAWEVEAYVGQTFIARSEQWKFKVKKEEEKKEKPSYVLLKTDDNSVYQFKDILYFTYIENRINNALEVKIYNLEEQLIYNGGNNFEAIRGENSYDIKLNEGKFYKNTIYILVLKNIYNEQYVLKFKLL
ncbi:MAG: hypothetical protein Q8K70_00925 [Bacteroidota bacterium]|nr:hypothetical protein [Bacteroidota bacterium]